MGIFNRSSKKDGAPPEKRRVPPFAENLQADDDQWITGQVFVAKDDKNHRVYFAAAKQDDYSWTIKKYSYSIKQPEAGLKKLPYKWLLTVDDAIALIAGLDKISLEVEGSAPVPGLNGNFRDIANLHSAYIDDQGNYVSLAQNQMIEKDAVFDRKGLQALYSKAAEKPAEPFIKTWDDFYREIVNKCPPCRVPLRYDSPNAYHRFVKNGNLLFSGVNAFDKKMMDSKVS